MPRKVLDIKKVRETREARDAVAREQARTTRPSQKPMRLKVKRRRQQLLAACLCVLGIATAVAGVGGMSHVGRLAIVDVKVTGIQELAVEDVVRTAHSELFRDSFEFFSRKNMFLYPKGTIEKKLATEFPRIRTVEVKREALLAQSVLISIEERRPFATWCSGTSFSNCFVMDREGYLFAERTGENLETNYIFRGALSQGIEPIGQTFLLGRLEKITELLAYLAQNGYSAEGISIQNDKDFEAPLLRGPVLRIPFDTDPGALVKNMELALESEALKADFSSIDYLDLRFGNRVYFKMKNQIAPDTEVIQ